MRRIALLSIDLLLVASATLVAIALRYDFNLASSSFAAILPYLLLSLVVAAVMLPAFGAGRSVWRLTTMRDYLHLSAATASIVVCGVALGFAYNRLEGIPRSVPVLQALVMLFALVGVRVLLRLRHAARQRPRPFTPLKASRPERTILVIGLSRLAEAYLLSINEFAKNRVRVAGLLGRREGDVGRIVLEQPVLGLPEQVKSVLQDLELHGVAVSEIVVATRFSRLTAEARQTLLDVEQAGQIQIVYLAECMGFEEHLPRSSISAGSAECSALAFVLDAPRLEVLAARSYWRLKRMIDITVSLFSLIVLSPVMAATAALVVLDVGSPIVFAQQRPGLGQYPFRLIKFRTMGPSHDAEGRRIHDTKRLSAIGRFLRRTRLDELPQLWHVLVGDMSFIGPRPLLPADQSPDFALRLLVRPGITGWAQVIGGRDISPLDKAALDVWYVQNASLRLDLEIVLRTIPLLLFGERISRHAIERAWTDLTVGGICRIDPTRITAWQPAQQRSRAA